MAIRKIREIGFFVFCAVKFAFYFFYIKMTVQMLQFVTDCSCHQSFSFDLVFFHIFIKCYCFYIIRTGNNTGFTWHTKTSFFPGLFSAALYDAWVDHDNRTFSDIDDNNSFEDSNLRCRKTYPHCLIHGL